MLPRFHDVIAKAVTRLVASLEAALEPSLRSFAAVPWATLDVVDEESAYVRMLSKAVDRVVPLVRGLLGKLYFRNFCDKFAASFLPKFYDLVVNTKKMSEMGTHQLLLDLHSIKPALLALPNAGLDKADENRKPPPPAYVKYVNKHANKVEMLLKLVGTPTDMLVERFKIMWPDGTADDLATVMSLKDIRKAEFNHLLETFGGPRATKPNDATTNARHRDKTPPPARTATSQSPPPTSQNSSFSSLKDMKSLGSQITKGLF